MSKEINLAAQKKMGEAISKGNLEVLHQVMSPSVVDHDPAPDQGQGPRGVYSLFYRIASRFPRSLRAG